jgi:hypothetical protein
MRWRRFVGIVALLGVLLNAGAIVRHNAAMLAATFDHHALLSDLAQICHGAGTGAETAVADLPALPSRPDVQKDCPVCTGLGAVFALAPPILASIALPAAAAVAFHFRADAAPGPQRAFAHPPARAPPRLG